MQFVYIVVIGIHVMAGVFWAGTTITLARDPEIKAERFIRPQLGASVLVFLTGVLLWHFFHEGGFGAMEKVLALGILSALVAAGVQGALVSSASRRLGGTDAATQAQLRVKMTRGERISAWLLVLTVLCMATAKLF